MPVDNNTPEGFRDRKYFHHPPKSPPKPKDALYFLAKREQQQKLVRESRTKWKLPNLRQPSRVCSKQTPRLLRAKHTTHNYVKEHVNHRNDPHLRKARSQVDDHVGAGAVRNGATFHDFVRENKDDYRLQPDLDQAAKVDDRLDKDLEEKGHGHKGVNFVDQKVKHEHDPQLRQAVRVNDHGGKINHKMGVDFMVHPDPKTTPNLRGVKPKVEDRVTRALLHLCDPSDHDYVHENAHPTLVTDHTKQKAEMEKRVQTVHDKIDQNKKKLGFGTNVASKLAKMDTANQITDSPPRFAGSVILEEEG